MQEELKAYYSQNEIIFKKIEEAIKKLIQEDEENTYLYVDQLSNMANGLRITVQGNNPTFRGERHIFNEMVKASYQRKKVREYNENWDI